MKVNEKSLQAKLMIHAMDEKNHILAVPNITVLFRWECDLFSLTNAFYGHEYEIKTSRADYKQEFKNKTYKHKILQERNPNYYKKTGCYRIPNYFWFITVFEIDPPEYAGWIQINDTGKYFDLWIRKNAPKLHKNKITEKKLAQCYKILSYRLKNLYATKWLR